MGERAKVHSHWFKRSHCESSLIASNMVIQISGRGGSRTARNDIAITTGLCN